MPRVESPQDLWAGALFLSAGGLALWLGRDYAFGSLTAMGPGFLPRLLSFALMLIGGGLMLRSLVIAGPALEPSAIRPQLFVLAAIVVFALTIETLGLAPAVVLVTATAALAVRDIRAAETVALALVLALFCVGLFVHLLGQPFRVWGP
jgi:hypothetical protein